MRREEGIHYTIKKISDAWSVIKMAKIIQRLYVCVHYMAHNEINNKIHRTQKVVH